MGYQIQFLTGYPGRSRSRDTCENNLCFAHLKFGQVFDLQTIQPQDTSPWTSGLQPLNAIIAMPARVLSGVVPRYRTRFNSSLVGILSCSSVGVALAFLMAIFLLNGLSLRLAQPLMSRQAVFHITWRVRCPVRLLGILQMSNIILCQVLHL